MAAESQRRKTHPRRHAAEVGSGAIRTISPPGARRAERLISPEAVFDLLARPDRHRDFDGSGTVQGARREGRRLRLGDSFGMDMHWRVPYATRNVVTEFDEGRRIAWRTLAPTPLTLLFTGRTWRYELEPVEGGTKIRETWDVRTEALPTRFLLKPLLAEHTRQSMERTLARIEELLTH